MIIISTCKMGAGTFEAKFRPLEQLSFIENIFVLRKSKINGFKKLKFIILPKFCSSPIINFLVTPFILAKETKKNRADVIIAYHFIPHAVFAYIASFITGKPYIIGQTGLYIQNYLPKPIIGTIIKYIAKRAMYINVPGEISKNFWIQKGIDDKKINILHSTIDSEYFVPDGTLRKYDFIYLGRIAPEKQVNSIIDALYKMHSENLIATMLIVGDGKEMNSIKTLVKKYKLEDYIFFTGFQDDVKMWLNSASIFVMASRSEGLPTALMQAMACELICISSDVGNISNLIEHNENGLLYSYADKEALPRLMMHALINLNRLDAMRVKARQTILKNHSYESAREKWKKLFNTNTIC